VKTAALHAEFKSRAAFNSCLQVVVSNNIPVISFNPLEQSD
jgi:hypothetical protein